MRLGKLLIIATKVIPIIMAISYIIDDILMFYGIDSVFINYFSGISLLSLVYFYLTSFTLKFCKYHRIPLHYIIVCNVISFYDFYIGIPISDVNFLMSRNKAKAVTYSNLSEHISIVLFNHHKSPKDYLNSIVHEAEHIKQAMLKVYRVEDKGEPPAYTIGYIVMRMYEVFKYFICS